MPIKRAQENGKYYYQYGESGTKYFYITNNNRSRKIAKRKALTQSKAIHANQSGGKVKKEIIPIWGGAAFRFNTQTPERMAEIQAKYKGQANPDFIDRYADILNQNPKMMGWRASVPSSDWYPEEHAAYLRDGRPKNKEDIARIMGTWGNPRQYGSGSYREIIPPVLATTPMKKRIAGPAGQFRNFGNVQLNGQNG